MKNTFGQSVAVTLFGESHGAEIGAVIDGMAPGILVDEDFIRHQLTLRRPAGKISTARVESDPFRIVSGVFEGRTTGTPICILIPNSNTKSGDYTRGLPRPGHADYTALCKYHGYEDYRGGGHFSGRITAPLVAAGAIAISALREKGIYIGTHMASVGRVKDRSFGADLNADIDLLADLNFPVLDADAADRMREEIEAAARDGDSVGGTLETVVTGMPAGVGEPWFDTVESILSHALFAIPAIKGVAFGDGFEMAQMRGSEANDALTTDGNTVTTKTNHNGGINGGITNGMPLCFTCAVKPTPSIFKAQDTVDTETMQNATLELKGRHDPAIIHRARVVVDSMTALVLCDLLAQRFGTDYLSSK
ncbi:MAG: chorismate synthase [Clostridia bacterium]|nr:chorismate synthase [Clostridia bacterium]